MAFIAENTLNEILGRVDLVELISEYIPLKRAGRNYNAPCPFHHEKTPSFIVSPQKQIFHCFGCQAGGNAFGFLMQYEHLDFPEAVTALAKKTGVLIPQTSSANRGNQNQNLNNQLYQINEIAAEFYFNLLHSPEGAPALAHLKKRGISQATIQRFKLGAASGKWDSLLSHLKNKNIPLSLMEKAGLIIPKDEGGYYDRFRERLIIPIMDIRNKVIAFGARVLDQKLPKYLNSPETAIYHKSKTLFGLNLSKEAIAADDCSVIVEGYFDLIIPAQAGINNIAASCGTALTPEQIRLLKRYSRNLIMLYDSDNAGQAATIRSLDLLIEEDMNVKVVKLDKGYDPDNYLRHFGPDKFKELLKSARDIIDYKIEALKSKYNLQDISSKADLCAELLPLVNKFKSDVAKSEYLKKISQDLKIGEDSLWAELKKTKGAKGAAKLPVDLPEDAKLSPKSFSAERLLVKLLLEENELMEELRQKIHPDEFLDLHLNQITAKIYDLFNATGKIDTKSLINHFTDQDVSRTLCELAASEVPQMTDKIKLINDCVRKIKEDSRKLKQRKLYEQILTAQNNKDENRIQDLLTEFQFLAKKG